MNFDRRALQTQLVSRYQWVIVIALALTTTVSFGILFYSFTVFVEPMEADLGWSKEEITGAYTVSMLVGALSAAAIGRLIDRIGAKRLMTAGSIAACVLMLGWAVVESVPVFYALWLVLGIVSGMVFYEPAFALIFRWFPMHRSRALTVITFIAGFASVIFIPLSGALVEALGWRAAMLALTVIMAAVTIPIHAFVLRDRALDDAHADPAAPAPAHLTPAEAYRRPDFWWLAVGFTLSLFVVSGMSVHLVPYLISTGYAPAVAAGVGGAIGAVALPGRVIFTPLGARVSRHVIFAALVGLQGVGLIVLITVTGDAGVWLFVLLFGIGFGSLAPTRAQLIAETFGAAHFGTISGRMNQIGVLRAFGPLAISVVLSISGGYRTPVILLAAMSMLGALCILVASRLTLPHASPTRRPAAS
ncbi:MAG: MFS transporter [Anaerolineae bacterium]|nr:MFS transporter [Anaerolineae bacterium]GIK29695.1 MAG: MFS transporter [Chloroflexota bacterium]